MPVIPPDTRAAGQTGHIADHNAISDVLTAQGAQLAAMPGLTYGQVTLVAGTAAVADTALTAASLPMHSRLVTAGTPGTISASVTPGVSVTFTSTSATDTSTLVYLILN